MTQNALERRIRRFAQLLVAEGRLKNAKVTFGIKLLIDRHHPIWLRILCSVVIFLSSTLLVIQSVDRFMHYLSYPVKVDVNIKELETISFPEIIIPSPYTKEIFDLMTVAGIESTDTGACADLMYLLLYSNTTNVTSLWRAANTSLMVFKHDIVQGTEVKEFPMTTRPNPYGTAAVFSSREQFSTKGNALSVNIQLSRQNKSCAAEKILAMFSDFDSAVDIENMVIIPGGYRVKIGLFMKQYLFINRPNAPCSEDEETYKNCKKQCRIQEYKKQSCNFPFMPPETRLPACKMGNASEFDTSTHIFLGVNSQFLACPCLRPCSQTFYRFIRMTETKAYLGTDITVYFINNVATVYTERQAYDFISFLSDSGGNMGLFLGLSLLDFIHWLPYLVTWKCHKKTQLFTNNDPILNIVKKEMNKMTLKNNNIKRNMSSQIIKLQFLFISLVALLALFMIGLRVKHFFCFPTNNMLTIKDAVYVQYPVMTLCWDSKTIASRKKYLARKQKHLPDPCKVSLLDLMGPPLFYSAHKIWMQSYNDAISWNSNPVVSQSRML